VSIAETLNLGARVEFRVIVSLVRAKNSFRVRLSVKFVWVVKFTEDLVERFSMMSPNGNEEALIVLLKLLRILPETPTLVTFNLAITTDEFSKMSPVVVFNDWISVSLTLEDPSTRNPSLKFVTVHPVISACEVCSTAIPVPDLFPVITPAHDRLIPGDEMIGPDLP